MASIPCYSLLPRRNRYSQNSIPSSKEEQVFYSLLPRRNRYSQNSIHFIQGGTGILKIPFPSSKGEQVNDIRGSTKTFIAFLNIPGSFTRAITIMSKYQATAPTSSKTTNYYLTGILLKKIEIKNPKLLDAHGLRPIKRHQKETCNSCLNCKTNGKTKYVGSHIQIGS